jgi:hypothetical protein
MMGVFFEVFMVLYGTYAFIKLRSTYSEWKRGGGIYGCQLLTKVISARVMLVLLALFILIRRIFFLII